MHREQLRTTFAARFGRPCQIVTRAPGRVNLIGEHTDYNEGFVLPIATQYATWVALAAAEAARGDPDEVRVYSANLDQTCTWPVGTWAAAPRPQWSSYVAGVAALLRARGVPVSGFDAVIDGDLPLGAGLSSSAALSVAFARALLAFNATNLPVRELAALCRAAEHEFAGVPCGFMDQYAALVSRAGSALLLDCRTQDYEYVPLELGEHMLIVVDSGVRHELAASQYAQRQQQCAAALRYFQGRNPAVRALRDVEEEEVRAAAGQLPPLDAARARHVTSENRRTLAAADALRSGDLSGFGRLMDESHRSLREDYEVSCRELDQLVEVVRGVPGVLGARLTGAGFGGSIVALLRADVLDHVDVALPAQYDATARQARMLVIRPGPGASVEYP